VVSKENGLKNGTWGSGSPAFYHITKVTCAKVVIATDMDIVMIVLGFFVHLFVWMQPSGN
jgi:hypothetical protein